MEARPWVLFASPPVTTYFQYSRRAGAPSGSKVILGLEIGGTTAATPEIDVFNASTAYKWATDRSCLDSGLFSETKVR
jgi:hypothetical protein